MYQYHLQAAKVKDDIAHNRSPMINTTHKASLPKLYEARAACIYKPDGKCIGMMNPERFHHLRERFHEAQKTDYTEICLLLFIAQPLKLWVCFKTTKHASKPLRQAN